MTDVLAVVEHRSGSLREVSYEVVAAGRQLTDETGGDLHVAVISGDVERYAEEVNCEGVEYIHLVDAGEEFNHDVYVQAIEQLFHDISPRVLLAPHTANGLDYVPALANRLAVPLVTDAIGLALDDSTIRTIREMYGSKVETVVEADSSHLAVTIRPNEWPPGEPGGHAEIVGADVTIDDSSIGSRVCSFEETVSGDVDISEAEVLVSVGRGIEDEENLDLIDELAEVLDATMSASRPIVDNGWLPKNRQVGQSGKTVAPNVYLAIGISGAVQHVAGMKGSETIIAINTDPNAPIMDIADYAIHDDLFDVIPHLIEEFSE